MLGRPVAIKVVRHDAYDDDRHSGEMRALAGLSHPGLVTLYDAGQDQGRGYFVMELVEGASLADRLSSGPLTERETAAIGGTVADALAYVHRGGIVHRDVKPGNVLLDRAGRAKLADFGIARMVDSARVTATGLTLGTAAYLAPEQVVGAAVGPPADVYSLGLVLLECLTGRREYDGRSVEAALARLHRPPVPPAVLPADWRRLLTAMTAREPADRPTAAAAAASLRVLGTSAQPASTRTAVTAALSLPRLAPRRWRLAVARLAVILAVLGVGAALNLVPWHSGVVPPSEPAPTSADAPTTTSATAPPAPATTQAQIATVAPATPSAVTAPTPAAPVASAPPISSTGQPPAAAASTTAVPPAPPESPTATTYRAGANANGGATEHSVGKAAHQGGGKGKHDG